MGQPTPGEKDAAFVVVSGTFTATGASASRVFTGPFNVSISGFGVATVALQRSFDGGTTFKTITATSTGTPGTYTADAELVAECPEAGVHYRLLCTAYTSGTIAYRLSQ